MSVKRYFLDLPNRQYKGDEATRILRGYVADYFGREDQKELVGLSISQWCQRVYDILTRKGILSPDTSGFVVFSEPRRVAHRSRYVQLLKEFKLGRPIKKPRKKLIIPTKKPVARRAPLPRAAAGRQIRFQNYAEPVFRPPVAPDEEP